MSKNMYVGNLSYNTDETQLTNFFESAGFKVVRTKIITDRDTGRPRGFAFVEIDAESADEAISALDGQDLDGRNLRISEAREREDRGGRGGGGGGRGPRNRY